MEARFTERGFEPSSEPTVQRALRVKETGVIVHYQSTSKAGIEHLVNTYYGPYEHVFRTISPWTPEEPAA